MSVNEIRWLDVDSSQIKAISFESKEAALFVKFNRGEVYKYTPFTFKEYGDLYNAESVGKHFHKEIKNNKTATKLSNGSKS